MINVNELKRNAKNIVKKYSDAQVKVREATSNDPWGPSSTIMAEIADMTNNVVAFSEVMQMIWKRLNDHGKNWRHVFKSLVLLEYLIKTGNEKVAQQCVENIFAIQTLKDFQYIEEAKDHGSSIREKSKKLVALLKDPERLKAERARALKAKSRLIEAVSSSDQSGGGYGSSSLTSRGSNVSGDLANNGSGGMFGGSANNNNNNNSSSSYNYAEADSSSGVGALRSDIDSARPHSLTEEETQLKIALALSKEEAERQEKTRKNDELRLKLALDVSKQAAAANSSKASGSNDFMDDFSSPSTSMTSGPSAEQQRASPASSKQGNKRSNMDDLLGLSFTPTAVAEPAPSQPQVTSTIPNGLFSLSNVGSTTAPALRGARLEPQNDPWSVDPWQQRAAGQPAEVPLMGSQVIMPQPAMVPPMAGFSAATTASALPTAQPAGGVQAGATTTVPLNQFPIGGIDSIFANQSNQARKTLSKNPFED